MAYWFLDGGGGWRFLVPYVKKEDTVIGNPNINKFFERFIGCKTIYLKTPSSLYDGSKFSFLRNIISSKKEYNEYFKKIRGEEFYTFGGLTNIVYFSYLRKLSKHNKVTYVAKSRTHGYKEYYNKHWVLMKIIGFLMGINVGITKLLGNPLWYMKQKTVDKYQYLKYEMVEPSIDFPKKYKKLLEGKKTLILLNDFSTLANNADDIFESLVDIFESKTTTVKNHTRNPPIPKEFDFDLFPSYIPAEILITSHYWENIVSIYITKSLLKKTKSRKISLYYLFNWKHPVNDEWIEKYKRSNVLLPKTRTELNKIL